jgi:hypothetical protein
VSRVDAGAYKIKSGNVYDHLVTHGMSPNLTPAHQKKVLEMAAAKVEKAAEKAAEKGAGKAGSKRPKPDAGAGAAGAGAGAGSDIVVAGGGAAPTEKQVTAWVVRMCSIGALPFNIVNNVGFRYLMSKLRLAVPNYSAVRRQFIKDVEVVENEVCLTARSRVHVVSAAVVRRYPGIPLPLALGPPRYSGILAGAGAAPPPVSSPPKYPGYRDTRDTFGALGGCKPLFLCKRSLNSNLKAKKTPAQSSAWSRAEAYASVVLLPAGGRDHRRGSGKATKRISTT